MKSQQLAQLRLDGTAEPLTLSERRAIASRLAARWLESCASGGWRVGQYASSIRRAAILAKAAEAYGIEVGDGNEVTQADFTGAVADALSHGGPGR